MFNAIASIGTDPVTYALYDPPTGKWMAAILVAVGIWRLASWLPVSPTATNIIVTLMLAIPICGTASAAIDFIEVEQQLAATDRMLPKANSLNGWMAAWLMVAFGMMLFNSGRPAIDDKRVTWPTKFWMACVTLAIGVLIQTIYYNVYDTRLKLALSACWIISIGLAIAGIFGYFSHKRKTKASS
ncbi:MAG TPA: hypothetical protein VLA77_02165 [Candidatus Saccharimonadales bacterium]|nr:hypothetical protein [Candidatus Saccharimonadales bacterium]